MIYYDVSESRAKTRLSGKIVEIGEPVVGLESATAADILITAKEGLPGNVHNPPGSAMLSLYIEDGFLIQRKSGLDLLNSIEDLSNILWRMRAVSDENRARPILLVCGEIGCTADFKVEMDGRTTGWNWISVQMALLNFQILGGYVVQTHSDDECGAILEYLDRLVPKFKDFNDKHFELKPNIPKIDYGKYPWRDTLMTFPGIGDIASDKIAEYCDRLCDAIIWLSEIDSYGVTGVGEKTRANARKKLGLKDGEHISIIREMPNIHVADL